MFAKCTQAILALLCVFISISEAAPGRNKTAVLNCVYSCFACRDGSAGRGGAGRDGDGQGVGTGVHGGHAVHVFHGGGQCDASICL